MLKSFFGSNIFTKVIIRHISRVNTDLVRTHNEFGEGDLNELNSVKKLSRAMKNYLKKSEEFGKQMVSRGVEYEIGKRHLANMMGIDLELLNQKAIDEAIEYLLPSGLFAINARPKMKPPEEIFPKHKELQFDAEGKPYNSFFYTTKANYYSLIYDIVEKLEMVDEQLNKAQGQALKSGVPQKYKNIDLTGTKLMAKETLEKKLLESISKYQYNHFVTLVNRLCAHPMANLVEEFILANLDKMDKISLISDIPPIRRDESGKLFSQAYGKRKTCWAHATLTELSSLSQDGRQTAVSPPVTINDKGIDFFPQFVHRGQVLLPLMFMGKLGDFGVEVRIQESELLGDSARAGATRLAIARALTAFLGKSQIEEMRLAGLLSYDVRIRERKKPGQKGARAKFRWRKR